MKMVEVEQTDLDSCVIGAQSERIVVTRDGSPVALIVGVEGLDEEQMELGMSDSFWKLIRERRNETTVSRAKLEQGLRRPSSRKRQRRKI